jgi:hypothetical protein
MKDMALIVGVAVMMVGTVVSRRMTEGAFRRLDDATRIRLMDAFSSMRIWNVVPLFALLGAVFLFRQLFVTHGSVAWALFSVALVGYLATLHLMTMRKLSRLALPTQYLKAYKRSRLVGYGTLLIFWAAIVVSLVA